MDTFRLLPAPPTATADQLGNFELQGLMNQFNQNEQLASSVLKKRDDTSSAVIAKVG